VNAASPRSRAAPNAKLRRHCCLSGPFADDLGCVWIAASSRSIRFGYRAAAGPVHHRRGKRRTADCGAHTRAAAAARAPTRPRLRRSGTFQARGPNPKMPLHRDIHPDSG
jgi:hypothetical protein